MASFTVWIDNPKGRRYHRMHYDPPYQNIYEDDGNWTGGKVGLGNRAGTMMSISAPALKAWRGYEITEADMKALSIPEAREIYYHKYWMPVKGDDLDSQRIAGFLADMKSSGGGIQNIQKAANILGESLAVDGSFGQKSLDAINRLTAKSEAKLNNAFRETQIEFYRTRSKCPLFCKVWIGSLDRDYPKMSETAEKIGVPEWLNNYWWILASIGILILIIALIVWMKLKK